MILFIRVYSWVNAEHASDHLLPRPEKTRFEKAPRPSANNASDGAVFVSTSSPANPYLVQPFDPQMEVNVPYLSSWSKNKPTIPTLEEHRDDFKDGNRNGGGAWQAGQRINRGVGPIRRQETG
ncbi:MAG: hypothetical protein WBL61_14895 [Bryobacteraceae bacterium]